jgi:hypothetical protein
LIISIIFALVTKALSLDNCTAWFEKSFHIIGYKPFQGSFPA